MATARSNNQAAVANLHRWNTISDDGGVTYYLLTDEAREILEDYYLNGGAGDATIWLEIATGKNGIGTGKMEEVFLGNLCCTLRSGQINRLPDEAF